MQSVASSSSSYSVPAVPRAAMMAAAVTSVAWLVGVVSYLTVQGLLRLPDLESAAFWSAVASLLLLPLAAMPLLWRARPSHGRRAPFVLVWGTILGLLPVAFVSALRGIAHAGPIVSAPAACFAGVALVTFAAGYVASTVPRT